MDVKAINTLKSLYQTRIDALTDTLANARAQVALSAWESAEIQYQEILAASVTQYTAAGRTISKRAISQAIMARNAARMDLDGEIGTSDAGVSLADFGGCL
jgi:hypothetical protein